MQSTSCGGVCAAWITVWTLLATCLALGQEAPEPKEDPMAGDVPENLYTGELVSYPGAYSFLIGKQGIILVSDAELEALSSDPDAVIDLSLTFDKQEDSLRAICERAKAAGQRTLLMSFDHFFAQYRPGQQTPRKLMPDTDEYIQHIAKIGAFAKDYGLAFELSLLSPLEIGTGYRARTGESGLWMHYRKGVRDATTGQFSVQLWRQRQWVNNKGPFAIEDAGVRVFAFRERRVPGTPYLAVAPEDIVEVTDATSVEVWEGAAEGNAVRIRVSGNGRTDVGPLDRVLVVQSYRSPEMDYFSGNALPFLVDLTDRYVDAGVRFNGLYADEMHIQQDWNYFGHHDGGEFALRYVSDGLRKRFAATYGAEYEDLAKYLVYFCHGQEDSRHDLDAKSELMHVFGPSPEDIRRTALFRARYFRMLQDGVVDLFVAAKHHLEHRMGYKLESRAHATWAESPTIDKWEVGQDYLAPNQYDYTSNFQWSCTVHQAAAACHDYFKWGDYLTGNGNDHSEGGWLDRDYFALALGCSTGIINEVPYSYAAHWGSPGAIGARHGWLEDTFGTSHSPYHGMVHNMQHRDVDVLLLYPLELVSTDERFGSWTVQYGYANYITTAKLLELGTVRDGAIEMAGRRFTTLVALFEPHPPRELLSMMQDLAAGGGKVIWSGPPPLLAWDGTPLLEEWEELFAADFDPRWHGGRIVPGRRVEFEGALAGTEPQMILTDLLVDHSYPATPREGGEVVARLQHDVVGIHHGTAGGGSLTFLGFRPRDDQSQSLGYDVRTLFEVLSKLGAYPPTGAFEGVNDNTEFLSRTGPYLTCRFPNGSIAVAPHLRQYEEGWGGGFARKPEDDAKILEDNPPPSPDIALSAYKVNGHVVDYTGQGVVGFRMDDTGDLTAFAGHHASSITVDGKTWEFAPEKVGTVFFAPVEERRRVDGGATMVLWTDAAGEVRVPRKGLPDSVTVYAEGPAAGSRGTEIAARTDGDALVVNAGDAGRNRWLYVVPQT